jgi:hypothetical protein
LIDGYLPQNLSNAVLMQADKVINAIGRTGDSIELPLLHLAGRPLYNRIGKLFRIRVLLKSHYLAMGDTPDMGELRLDFPISFFVPSAVSAEHDNMVSGVQPLFRHDRENRPLGSKSHKDAFKHRLRAVIGIPVGIDEVFRLPPLDFLMHLV